MNGRHGNACWKVLLGSFETQGTKAEPQTRMMSGQAAADDTRGLRRSRDIATASAAASGPFVIFQPLGLDGLLVSVLLVVA